MQLFSFVPRRDFRFEVPGGCEVMPLQTLPAGAAAWSREPRLRQALEGPWRGELASYQRLEYRGASLTELRRPLDSLLVLSPTQALGDGVELARMLSLARRHFGWARLGLAFVGASADVVRVVDPQIELYPSLLPEAVRQSFAVVATLDDLLPDLSIITDATPGPALALQRALGLPAQPAVAAAEAIAELVFCPQSTAALRTLPVALIRRLAARLGATGLPLRLQLDRRGRLGEYLEAELLDAPFPVGAIDSPDTRSDLLRYMRQPGRFFVAADSGPLHLALTFNRPVFSIFTSIGPAATLGPHDPLMVWQSRYAGVACVAPCGLAGLVQRLGDDEVGCYDSFGAHVAVRRPLRQSDATVERFFHQPVGCVRALVADADAIADRILDALERLRA